MKLPPVFNNPVNLYMNKKTIIIVLTVLIATTAGAQEKKEKERTIALWGHVKNSVTRVGI